MPDLSPSDDRRATWRRFSFRFRLRCARARQKAKGKGKEEVEKEKEKVKVKVKGVVKGRCGGAPSTGDLELVGG